MDAPIILPTTSAGAGAKLHWHAWLLSGTPRAAVLLIHGYAEHLGRYADVAATLNAKGLAVYAHDHWGHGKSSGTPGFVPAFSAFTDGVDALLAQVKSRHPGLPLILIGHSMGGLISATHLLSHQAEYAGAILSGPAIKPAEEPSRLMIFISRLLSRLLPKMGVLGLDANGVSRDPKVVSDYLADPLVYTGKISARLAKEMFEAMHRVQAEARTIRVPMLILHGAEDSLAAPEGSQYLYDHLGSPDKQIKIYPHLFHEIFNEPEREAVLADVTGWIDAHLPKAANP